MLEKFWNILLTPPWSFSINKYIKVDESRIVLGTGYPWLESFLHNDKIQRVSLYTKRNGGGKLVNLKTNDKWSVHTTTPSHLSTSKKYRLVLEKM